MKTISSVAFILILVTTSFCSAQPDEKDESDQHSYDLTENEWRQRLTPLEYKVLREKGTEIAFTGEFWDHKEKGIYTCGACGLPLFESSTKFRSGTGWPSFYEPINEQNVAEEADRSSYGMVITEVLCSRCDSHLGHVFPDGPEPTGLRYCINSVSLDFEKK